MRIKSLTAAFALAAAWGVQAHAGVDPLTQIQPPSNEWTYDGSNPDQIIEVPSFTVPATGVIDYINSVIPLEFEEEKWVKAVQFIPGDKRVLHHLLSYVVAHDGNNEGMIDEASNDPRREFLEGYAPGKEYATEFPENTGIKVPVGSALRMSIHYTSFGQETVDNTRVGLWFADENDQPELEYHTYSVSANGAERLHIPPGAMEHEMAASHVFEDAIVLHGFRAHMHYRGKSMSARVIYPDNTQEQIINVANYNFAWQPTYRMDEPMVLPAGSRVVVEGLFDNSEYNPGNPDPTVPAVGGPQSWEEMFIGYFSYTDVPN
ncbi:hypothetical protein QGM61_01515 [Pseudohongiella sp. SYSU M77423]|uniref:monooxygenase n=1 Tax=Pseudohongiella sp. SYSU M77423 TaxID=3042312 RepID=UPI000C5D6BF4|nr:hypothetical protein [Pseudohongiella sp. SYSU M77423]MAO39976.1 hypothetical protein [Pseudohongiella sp.]MAY57114.1 hypothetical protein [Gammaproteobacteria bacterium]MBJ54978.1 hypothetical protein [Gammaproteobacteria bacterium]MDH7942485.1 hypothetical protein [Pseudohongiella sp. SYSU M77423]HBN15116.1 hypothetical protein [Pseudohongiella sp.]|tara:strand:- start:196527 stop:197483 length:957 start_codon:yes stop_codon:yes gene_type:complete